MPPRQAGGQPASSHLRCSLTILAAGGIDRARHVTAEIGLSDIVSRGFEPLVERRAEHIKIQVTPDAAS